MEVVPTPIAVQAVLRDMKGTAVPTLRDLAVAGAGFTLMNYGGQAVLGKTSSFTQGLVQGTVGVVGMVIARRMRSPLLETAAFGAGLSGMMKVLYGVFSAATAATGGNA